MTRLSLEKLLTLTFAAGAPMLLSLCVPLRASAQVKTGLDVLVDEQFKPLAGKRVGLATNQSGITRDRRRNIDVFAHAPSVKLTAIFSFEHGLNGIREDTHIGDSVDEATGIPVYSLYNYNVRKPTPEMLKNVDVLVFDKQDNGARFYTSVTSMAYLLEAAAEHHIRSMFSTGRMESMESMWRARCSKRSTFRLSPTCPAFQSGTV